MPEPDRPTAGHPFLRHFGIDIRERVQQAFGMPARRAPEADDIRWQRRIAPAGHTRRLPLHRHPEVAAVAMRPLDHAAFAVHAKADVVLAAGRRLQGRERPAKSASNSISAET